MMVGGPGQPASVATSREDLVTQWKTGGWRPAGRLVFDGGRVYLKTPERLVSYDAAAIQDQPIWQSAWENRYELDSMSQQLAMFAMQMGGYLPQQSSNKPRTPTEVLLFGDRVHQSMSIADGAVYSIEGRRATGEATPQTAARGLQWGTTPRRSRTNWLSAYQASGGKALWTRSASDDDKEGSSDVGFLAAPTPCAGILLTPVTDGGTIWLYGLDRTTGKTLWKAYLCDEPQGGAPPWAEIVIAVDGREAYLSCGCGVVFAIDAVAGNIRWAARYQRDGKSSVPVARNPYGNISSLLDISGWDDDVVIPYGRLLVVMASDSDRLLALDRRTGERAWESPRVSPFGTAASYCLGVHGRGLFVADKNVIRRYDIPSGRLEAERAFEQSFGRGCLTEDAIYLPVKDSILKLSLDLKETLSHVGVALTSDEPVGNLFSDGEKLWVVGAGRVYAMTTLEHRLSMLGEQIAAGDAEAQLNRMRLYFKQNRNDLALADLKAAYGKFQSQLTADAAAQRLFAVMSEQKLPQTQPLVTLPLLTDLFAASSVPQISRESSARLRDLVAGSISALRQQKPRQAVTALLGAAGLYDEDYLITAATFAVDAAAGREEIGRLIEAIESGAAAAQLVSIRAAVRLAPDDAKTPLLARLEAGDDRVRLAAARALANLGERDKVLQTLLSLLESNIVQVRTRSHQTLQALTSQQIPFAPEGTPADRALAVKNWRQWIETSGSTAKLNLPLSERTIMLDRILLASPAGLVELDANRSQRWQTRLAGSAWGCQGLPNGHRLVAINSHAMIVEYDDSGKEVWRKDRLPAPPTSVQRLESGSTLVACGNAQQIVEIAPDGSTTTINVPGNPISAQRLDNGNTLVAVQQTQRVVEVDGYGRVVWEARTGGHPPWHAVRLENGNTLVTLTQARKVVEYDPTGKTTVWQTAVPLVNPSSAQRLPSGQTLVADHNGVHLIDAAGTKIEWTHRQQGVTGLSSF
jgi:outer membrane protein assembly factor BamB